ncbi:unnamed protein product [Orchesella dallaii]|uniref:PROP1-like PPR domain-containing protein n=1 Tax=Orchesella dallaii TaxID=48710 RepID=A0ABP1QJN3_9HEXA
MFSRGIRSKFSTLRILSSPSLVTTVGVCECRHYTNSPRRLPIPNRKLLLKFQCSKTKSNSVTSGGLTSSMNVAPLSTFSSQKGDRLGVNGLGRNYSDVIASDDDRLPDANFPVPNSGGKKPRTLDQVIYHMQADIRRKRRVHKAEMNNAVELIEKGSKVDNFGNFLLNCCCDVLPDFHPSRRIELAKRIWKVIRDTKTYIPGNFENMLKTLALNEDTSEDPFQYFEEARSNGFVPSSTMYFFALLLVCQRGDIDSSVKLLNIMKDDAVPVNEKFFNVLILGNARNGDLKSAREILEIMKASLIEPSAQTWAMLLRVYIEAGDIDELKKIYSEIPGIQLSEDQFYELLKVAGQQTNADITSLVIDWALASKKIQYLSVMSAVLQLMFLGHQANALTMVLKFSDILRDPLGGFFIKDLHFTNLEPDAYLSLVSSLQAEDRNPYALNIAAESCLKHKRFDLAFKIFEGMVTMDVPLRPHYFLPAFIEETDKAGITGAVRVLQKMRNLSIQLDWEMLVGWVVPKLFKETQSMLEVSKIIHQATGMSYSSGVLSSVICVALQEKLIKEVVCIVERLKGKLIHADNVVEMLFAYICDPEIESSDIERDFPSIIKILTFISENVPSDDKKDYVGSFILRLIECDRSETAEALIHLINCESKIAVSDSASKYFKEKLNVEEHQLKIGEHLELYNGIGSYFKTLEHPRDMDTTALEDHTEELLSKDLNARGTYRKLFLKYCQNGTLAKALGVRHIFERDYGEISSGMKSALMGAYINNGNLEAALKIFDELRDKQTKAESDTKVDIDVYKIIDLATLMTKKGFTEHAIDILLNECQNRNISNPGSISRNICRLLEALSKATASTDDSDIVFEITEFFLDNRLITPGNPVLAPSIKDLVRRGRLDAAVQRLEMYTEKFHLAPGLQELTYAVMDESVLLERTLKCSMSVKGMREAKRLLAIAKSDLGNIDGAATLFRELGEQLSFLSVIRQCEYYASKNQMDKLLNLIKSLHKTGSNYDTRKLYELAVKACERSNDNEGMKKFLHSMEEHDLYVSPKYKKALQDSS